MKSISINETKISLWKGTIPPERLNYRGGDQIPVLEIECAGELIVFRGSEVYKLINFLKENFRGY